MLAAAQRVMAKLAQQAHSDPVAARRLQKAHQIVAELGKGERPQTPMDRMVGKAVSGEPAKTPSPLGPSVKPYPKGVGEAIREKIQWAIANRGLEYPEEAEDLQHYVGMTAEQLEHLYKRGHDFDGAVKPGDLRNPQWRDAPPQDYRLNDPGQMEEAYKAALKEMQGDLASVSHPGDKQTVQERIGDLERAFKSGDPKKFGNFLANNVSASLFDRFGQGIPKTPAVTSPATPIPQSDAGPKFAREGADVSGDILRALMDSNESPGFVDDVRQKLQLYGTDWLRNQPKVVARLAQIPALKGLVRQLGDESARPAGEEQRLAAMTEPREQDALGFTSNINDALRTWQNKGTPQQLLAHLQKTAGASAQADAIGLKSWLEGKQSVSRQEVADFVRGEYPELREVSEAGPNSDDPIMGYMVEGSQNHFASENAAKQWVARQPNPERFGAIIPYREPQGSKEPKFASYQLPGPSENYDEVHISVPSLGGQQGGGFWVTSYNAAGEKTGRYHHKTAESAEEAKRLLEAHGLKSEIQPEGALSWQDGHSDYSHVQNPVVRARFNTRTDADGKKMLFIEELQGPNAANQEKMPQWLRDRIYDIGLKRMIRKAVEEGYDRIGWTTGEQQDQRYGGGRNQGLKDLYDKVLPAKAAKLLKRAGGQVGQGAIDTGTQNPESGVPSDALRGLDADGNRVRIGTGEFVGVFNRSGELLHKVRWDHANPHEAYNWAWENRDKLGYQAKPETPVHSIDLTPQVKAQFGEGVPLFMKDQETTAQQPVAQPLPRTPQGEQTQKAIADQAGASLASANILEALKPVYAKHLNDTLSRMTDNALKALHASGANWTFHGSIDDIMTSVESGAYGEYAKSKAAETRANAERWGGVTITGADGKVHILVDGGRDTQKTGGSSFRAGEIYAHEGFHPIDRYRDAQGRVRLHSDSLEFKRAWSKEMANTGIYGGESPIEGWAELGRFITTGDPSASRAKYPGMYEYMLRRGIAPDVEPKPGVQPAEVFTRKVPLDRHGGHADVIAPVLDAAPDEVKVLSNERDEYETGAKIEGQKYRFSAKPRAQGDWEIAFFRRQTDSKGYHSWETEQVGTQINESRKIIAERRERRSQLLKGSGRPEDIERITETIKNEEKHLAALERTQGQLDDPNPIQIFRFVANSVRSLIQEKDPHTIRFVGTKDEPSRLKLYDHLARRMAREGDMELEINDDEFGKEYVLTKPVVEAEAYQDPATGEWVPTAQKPEARVLGMREGASPDRMNRMKGTQKPAFDEPPAARDPAAEAEWYHRFEAANQIDPSQITPVMSGMAFDILNGSGTDEIATEAALHDMLEDLNVLPGVRHFLRQGVQGKRPVGPNIAGAAMNNALAAMASIHGKLPGALPRKMFGIQPRSEPDA